MGKLQRSGIRVLFFALCGVLALVESKPAEAAKLTKLEIAGRAILIVDLSKFSEKSLRASDFTCVTLTQQDTLFYVDCDAKDGVLPYESLRRLSGVRSVTRDALMSPIQHALPTQPFSPKRTDSRGLDDKGLCRLTETCSDGRSKFWAQERVDADLMFKEINRIQLAEGHTKVAVVDTGFDMTLARTQIDPKRVSVSPGWEKAGDANRDELGHGTAVAGLIGGKDGIGIAPDADLTVYRVSEARGSGGATLGSLMASMKKACDEGNEIINLSWGGIGDESAVLEDEKSNKAFYDDMAARGCLIIKAAGNSARRVTRKSMTLDDAFLRVEATEPSGELSSFSSNGEVSAPGSGVFTLHSSQTSSAKAENTCSGHKGSFINGTSFAAPITAAIATQTLGVLKKSPEFKALTGPLRIAALNRVLAASTVGAGVNAMRAVLIAEMLVKSPKSFPAAEVQKISANFKQTNKSFCSKPPSACMPREDCGEQRECAQEARKHMALCDPPNTNVVRDLLQLSERSQANEMALNVMRHRFSLGAGEVSDQSRRIWLRLHDQWKKKGYGSAARGLAFDQALQLLPSLMGSRDKADAADAEVVLGTFLTSDQFIERLSRDLKADSKTDLDRSLGALLKSYEQMGPAKFYKVFSESITKNINEDYDFGTLETEGFTASARVIGAMIDAPAFGALRAHLLRIEKNLATKAVKTGLNKFPTETSYFDAMFSRNSDLIWGERDAALKSKTPLKMDSLALIYLSRRPDLIPADRFAEFNLKLVDGFRHDMASSDRYLSDGSSDLGQHAIVTLNKAGVDMKDSDQKAMRDSFQKSYEGKQNVKQLMTAYPIINSHFSDYRYRKTLEEPLYKGDFLHLTSEKIANALISDEKEWKGVESSPTSVLQKTIPFLIRRPESKALAGKLGTSLVQKTLKTASSSGSGSEFGYYEQLKLGSDLEAMAYLLKNSEARSTLKADPKFLESVRLLKADIAKRPTRYTMSVPGFENALEEFFSGS